MAARIPQEVREQQIAELCEGTIYSFVGWVGKFKGVRSKFTYIYVKSMVNKPVELGNS